MAAAAEPAAIPPALKKIKFIRSRFYIKLTHVNPIAPRAIGAAKNPTAAEPTIASKFAVADIEKTTRNKNLRILKILSRKFLFKKAITD